MDLYRTREVASSPIGGGMSSDSANNIGDAPTTSSKKSLWQRILSYLPEEQNAARKARRQGVDRTGGPPGPPMM